jgi:phosphoribosylaminoimidazolecarboxamide formyltransferase/IMP cyclohydrolase
VELVSTGGTARLLSEHGIPVTPVESLTGLPEMMDGRVKTLHHRIHAALLARRDHPQDMQALKQAGIEPLDMVVIDLYPFAATVARPACTPQQALDMIDIGGPTMLRAAAKNHRDVVVVPGQPWTEVVLEALTREGEVSPALRRQLAAEAFDLISRYDATVSAYLQNREAALPRRLRLDWSLLRATRYGENPHQSGGVYVDRQASFSHPNLLRREGDGADPLLGPEEISFNNYADAQAALELCCALGAAFPGQAAAVFIKHANPCGAGVAADALEAHRRAYLGDPQAAMGGVLAQNRPVSPELADGVMHTLQHWGSAAGAKAFFLEVWVAAQFDPQAVQLIRTAKPWGQRVRLFEVGPATAGRDPRELKIRSITGGALVQTSDPPSEDTSAWRVVSRRSPTPAEMDDLRLAWAVAAQAASNAVALCRNLMLLGSGAGQTSRVMSCRLAAWLARDGGHGALLDGAAAASDAFFPFPDGPEVLIREGVRAIVQPAGSKQDAEVIALCDRHDTALVFADRRHLRH